MSRTVYSLVLSDDVVAEIDRLAYRQNTNRSNMINQILAEYVSYVTPEKRMQDTFRRIEAMLTGQETLQLLLSPSDTMMTLRSALAYKYNPTVRYSVELYRTPGDALGELRVSLRTQNNALLLCMMRFYRLWAAVEQSLIGGVGCGAEEGKFARRLLPHTQGGEAVSLSGEELGELICAYIETFDRALKAYFYQPDQIQAAEAETEALYRAYLAEHPVIL